MDLGKILNGLEVLAHQNKCNCTPCQELRKYRNRRLEATVQGLRKTIEKLQNHGKDSAKVEDLT